MGEIEGIYEGGTIMRKSGIVKKVWVGRSDSLRNEQALGTAGCMAHLAGVLTDARYRVGLASKLLEDTKQVRLAEYEGLFAIDDPDDDDQGFCLRGDNLLDLLKEAVNHLNQPYSDSQL